MLLPTFFVTNGFIPAEKCNKRKPGVFRYGTLCKREKRQPGGLSAKQKRLEFVSAKRAASALQARAATIERTFARQFLATGERRRKREKRLPSGECRRQATRVCSRERENETRSKGFRRPLSERLTELRICCVRNTGASRVPERNSPGWSELQ